MSPAPLLSLHLGTLHGYETALLALLAFGPFVVLAVVVVVVRRRDSAEESDDGGARDAAPAAENRGSDR